MHEWETNEARIKQLEATVDALTYRLEVTNQLLKETLNAVKASATVYDCYDTALSKINHNIQTIKAIKPCSE